MNVKQRPCVFTQMIPPLPNEPPPEGSDSMPTTPELLSPDADYKVAPLAGIEGLELDESSSESVTPDMDSQVLFVKLKEVNDKYCPFMLHY